MPSFSDSSSDQASILDFADVDLCKANATKAGNGQEDKQVRLRLSLDEICHRTNFTRKEVRAFYRTLKQECPLGVVTEETLRDAYHRLFPNGNVGMYVKYVFRTLDTQGNGKITFTQLLVFLSTISKGTHLDRLKWIFRLYDLDGDGAIQHSELLNLCCAIHELAGTTEKRIFHETKKSGKEEMFSESEKDRKFRQIKLWVDKVFRRWDSNQDGQQLNWRDTDDMMINKSNRPSSADNYGSINLTRCMSLVGLGFLLGAVCDFLKYDSGKSYNERRDVKSLSKVCSTN